MKYSSQLPHLGMCCSWNPPARIGYLLARHALARKQYQRHLHPWVLLLDSASYPQPTCFCWFCKGSPKTKLLDNGKGPQSAKFEETAPTKSASGRAHRNICAFPQLFPVPSDAEALAQKIISLWRACLTKLRHASVAREQPRKSLVGAPLRARDAIFIYACRKQKVKVVNKNKSSRRAPFIESVSSSKRGSSCLA